MITQYNFFKTKYGDELLIDLVPLEKLQPYIDKTPTHSLTYYDITVISGGQGTFYIDQQNIPIEKGRVIFTLPGQVRHWEVDKMPPGYALLFEEEFLCSFFNDNNFVQDLSYFSDSNPHASITLCDEEYNQLMPLLQNIFAEIHQPQLKDKHVLRALLYQVLMILNRMFLSRYPAAQVNPANRHIQKFSHLVNSHYRNNRSVDFYAQQLNITPGHLNDLVRHHLGVSAKQHILNRTILEAKRLLNYTSQSIDEIAQHLNFENSSYFIRIFHKHTGETPLHFRNLQIRKK